jgi:Icc protein
LTASSSAIRNATDPVRVLHVTDPHLFSDAEGSLRGANTRTTLQSVLDHILAEAWPADLVALTGDLIQDDSRGAYKRVRDMLGTLELPVYCVPGNHDVRALMKAELRPPRFHYCTAKVHANWLIVGVDSCLSGEARGRIERHELKRLRKALMETDAPHVLLCLHHPPLQVGSRWLDSVGLENAADFLQVVTESGKVRAAIFGHVHQAFERDYAGVRIIGTPSTCRQFTVNSDEFSVDNNPPSYRRLTLQPDGSIESLLIWVKP